MVHCHYEHKCAAAALPLVGTHQLAEGRPVTKTSHTEGQKSPAPTAILSMTAAVPDHACA